MVAGLIIMKNDITIHYPAITTAFTKFSGNEPKLNKGL
ncbi:Uncharacterised protein [uncultured archaeon]|nr:Uncharacterised protein [uncultured archaeon]